MIDSRATCIYSRLATDLHWEEGKPRSLEVLGNKKTRATGAQHLCHLVVWLIVLLLLHHTLLQANTPTNTFIDVSIIICIRIELPRKVYEQSRHDKCIHTWHGCTRKRLGRIMLSLKRRLQKETS